MPQVRIADTGETFEAEDGETVLAAAQRAGIAMPYSCQAGNCGSCKCERIDGELFELDHSEYALTPAEQAQGLILACRSQVWGDSTIRLLAADEIVMHPSRILSCRVVRRVQLTHDIVGLHLQSDEAAPFEFSAGQYASLEFAPGLSRHYSMASMPGEAPLEFHIRHMPGGRCSGYVAERLAAGDTVEVSGPLGTACLRDAHRGPVLLIAGGSGLAPIQSILRTLLARDHPGEVRLYVGVRAGRDVYNEALLQDLADRHPGFRYQIVLSETAAPGRRSGLVHAAAGADLDQVTDLKAYIAGPPVMVEAATGMLREKGMAARDIHADAFYNQ